MSDSVYTVQKLEEGFWAIDERNVHIYLFAGETEALLVDTGFGGGDLAGLVRELTPLPVRVVISHADPDHYGGLGQFDEFWMRPGDYARLKERGAQFLSKARPLWEEDVLDIGAWRFAVHAIPGHTPGSVALLEEGRRMLLAGDSIQRQPIFMFGPGRSLPAYRESLRRLHTQMQGRVDLVYAGHGPLSAGPELIEALLDAADRVLAGAVQPVKADVHGQQVDHYDLDGIGFFYE